MDFFFVKLDLLANVIAFSAQFLRVTHAAKKSTRKKGNMSVAGVDLLESGMHERRQLLEYLLLLVRQCGLLAHLKGGDAKLAVDM